MNYNDLTQFYMGFYKTTPTTEDNMTQISIADWLERYLQRSRNHHNHRRENHRQRSELYRHRVCAKTQFHQWRIDMVTNPL